MPEDKRYPSSRNQEDSKITVIANPEDNKMTAIANSEDSKMTVIANPSSMTVMNVQFSMAYSPFLFQRACNPFGLFENLSESFIFIPGSPLRALNASIAICGGLSLHRFGFLHWPRQAFGISATHSKIRQMPFYRFPA